MTIGLIADTNIFSVKQENRYRGKLYLNTLNYYIDYANSLAKIKSENKLIFYIPEIVLEELYHQKLDAFRLKYDSMKKSYNEINYALTNSFPEENSEEIFKQEKEEYLKKANIIKLDYNEDLFKEIVDDALNKRPPFDANKPNVGFKDSLIWKSIIYSKDVDKCDNLIFISGDEIFVKDNNDEILAKEFSNKHPNTKLKILYCSPNGNQRQDALNIIIEDYKLPKTEFVKLYDRELIIEYFNNLKYEDEDVEFYIGNGVQTQLTDIFFKDFDIMDFSIINIDKVADNYHIKCAFRTKKYVTSIPIEEDIRKSIIGNIELILNEKDGNYKYVSSKVSDVEFDLGVIDLFRGLIIDGVSNIASKLAETIKANSSIYFDTIKPLTEAQEQWKEAMSRPSKEIQETLSKLNNAINIPKIPSATDLLAVKEKESEEK